MRVLGNGGSGSYEYVYTADASYIKKNNILLTYLESALILIMCTVVELSRASNG